MDAAADEQDVTLQRASADLLADLTQSLTPFLWRQSPQGGLRIRKRVRARETDRIVALVYSSKSLNHHTVCIDHLAAARTLPRITTIT